jgi:diguanylate cyclase (GGDEF)-like protein/PAS domain S-box-containing protein
MRVSTAAGWVRRNALLLAAAVATMGVVVVAGLLILQVADREDAMRESQTSLAELAPLSTALRAQAESVVERGDAVAGDRVATIGLGRSALSAARNAERSWSNAHTGGILATTGRAVVLNRSVTRRAAAGQLDAAEESLGRLVPTAESLSGQVRITRADLERATEGQQSEVLGVVLLITALAGAGLIAVMAAVVLARRRRALAEAEREVVRASERRLQALVRHGSDMITVVNPDTRVLFEAGAVREMLGYEPADLEGTKLTEWVDPEDAAELAALCAAADGGSSARELRFRHRDGSLRTCETRATSLLGDEDWDGIVLNVWDISERKQLEERLRHQAFHDALTGLANRGLFVDRLGQALLRGERGGHSVTVLLVDLDDFKAINDSFGHPAGDRLLREVGARLKSGMRAADTVARLGGDEFAVILDEDDADGGAAVERVFSLVESPFKVRGRSFPISASVGVASSTPGETAADSLIRNADLAMYAAKAQGKGRWTVYEDGMYFAAEQRLQLKADLAHAVEAGDQFRVVYQPVIELESGEVIGMEALLRWDHPTRGEVAPEEFIPLAEESGAIVEIGRWVLEQACRQGQAWITASGVPLAISVNVSARQISGGDLVADVRRALETSGLQARRLVIEVTESQLVRSREEAIAALSAIKELGASIAIGDRRLRHRLLVAEPARGAAGRRAQGRPCPGSRRRRRVRAREPAARGGRDRPLPAPADGDRGGRDRRAAGGDEPAPVHLRPGLRLRPADGGGGGGRAAGRQPATQRKGCWTAPASRATTLCRMKPGKATASDVRRARGAAVVPAQLGYWYWRFS